MSRPSMFLFATMYPSLCYFVLVTGILYIFLAAQSNADVGCSLNMNVDLPKKNEPLMLKKVDKQHKLVIPKVKGRQGLIELKKGEELILACPGKNNYLSKTKNNSTTSSCSQGTELTIGDINIKSVEAECAKQTMADISPVRKKCAKTGDLYEIGFKAEGWHPMINVCFHLAKGITFYTEHIIIGAAMKGVEHESDRPLFSDGDRDELYGFNPQNYYRKTAQEKYFSTIFGKTKASDYYSNDRYLSKGHLAPDGDFLFGSWQFATYFYINAAPQWQQINSGNWLTIEKAIRKLGDKLQKDLNVTTGTYGILSLKDDKGKEHELVLVKEEDKLPVPEYFWKVIYDADTKSGIAIVTSNNPYMTKNQINYLCDDIGCNKHHWLNNGTVISDGFTYCCEIDNFKKKVTFLPSFQVTKVLNGPLA